MPIVLNGSGPVTGVTSLNTTVSDTEIGYLDGVTAALQTQINTAGGLVKIVDQSFSAVSSVSVNSCFSATYQNYRVMLYTAASNTLNLRWRFRVSGSDNSTTNYERQTLEGGASTASASRATGQDHHNLGSPTSTDYGAHALDVWRPFEAAATAMTNTELRRSGPVIRYDNLQFTAATSFDGFTIYADANNITGVVRVYGYRN